MSKLEIRKATKDEIERVVNYYHNVIDAMEGSMYNPCWKKIFIQVTNISKKV